MLSDTVDPSLLVALPNSQPAQTTEAEATTTTITQPEPTEARFETPSPNRVAATPGLCHRRDGNCLAVIDLTATSCEDSPAPSTDHALSGDTTGDEGSDSHNLKRARSISRGLSTGMNSSNEPETTCTGPVHKKDLAITSRVGLDTLLKQVGTNHGFHTNIVNNVYKNSKSLRDTDEIVRIMREAAQERGAREIKRRSKKRKTA